MSFSSSTNCSSALPCCCAASSCGDSSGRLTYVALQALAKGGVRVAPPLQVGRATVASP